MQLPNQDALVNWKQIRRALEREHSNDNGVDRSDLEGVINRVGFISSQ